MPSRPVFSAPSLAEVLKQLRIYRPSGLLTVQRARGAPPEEVYITVERGQPTLVVWNRQQQEASEAVLAWLNSWGEIRFTFQSAEPLLQLPSPGQPELQEGAPAGEGPRRPTWPPLSLQSGPLPAVGGRGSGRQTIPLQSQPGGPTHPPGQARGQGSQQGPIQASSQGRPQNGRLTPRFGDSLVLPAVKPVQPLGPLPPETVVPSLTARGKEYAATAVPRYDRIVFLLINGRRTLGDLAQLTRRTPAEVYASLQRLQEQGLIQLTLPPTNGHGPSSSRR
ncbi:hypothetical protein [Thermogemmatispora sp.]|uniref:hypothetical protein n=1 Tax=Thermogemmatispora sp. TaxID=1968838 RepID=UPI001DF9E2D2|nr:hypothetical protein [Thermogemmatispora sp.]MBX5451353.1 hypothetical protein [Thermogemmatispora sp.]